MLHARLHKETQSYRDHHFQPTRTAPSSYPYPQSTPVSSSVTNNEENTIPYLDGHPAHDRPLIVQFCANDPNDLFQAARHVAPHCDAVDLNLGCPQGIARKGYYGSFLQESPNLIHSLISTLHKNLDVPVTAKMRILDTKEDTLRYAQLLLDAGVSWIAVHGRRREQKGHETGLADWNVIRHLRDQLPKETVIFANGNVLGHEDLQQCLEKSGADGVMSAEGNLCDPGIFAGEDGRRLGVESGEYWVGEDGKGGWRMDAVLRRYLDILYKFVLEKEPPVRRPLFMPHQIDTNPLAIPHPSPPPSPTPLHNNPDPISNLTTDDNTPSPPASKRRKHNRPPARTSSPNLLAIQAHLFHLLRPLLSRHTSIRDHLARTPAGDMQSYEQILQDVEEVTRQGLTEYKADSARLESCTPVEEQDEEEESSAKAVARCRRPWWVCQAYVRPLPKEALEKGSLKLGKKARRKLEVEEKEKETAKDGNGAEEEKQEIVTPAREEMDERDDVPREELPKEAMVCE